MQPPYELKVFYQKYTISKPLTYSAEVFEFFKWIWNTSVMDIQEEVYILYLNNNNEVITWKHLSRGSGDETDVFVKLAVALGLLCLASKVIIAHNHPCGMLTPSKKDVAITHKLSAAFKLIDVTLVDHLILSYSDYYSFADHRITIS